MTTPFWQGFAKQANALTSVFHGAETAAVKAEHAGEHVLNYGKGGNVFAAPKLHAETPALNYGVMNAPKPQTQANALNYGAGKLHDELSRPVARDQPAWMKNMQATKRMPQAQIDANRRAYLARQGLPGRFAREEGVGVGAVAPKP